MATKEKTEQRVLLGGTHRRLEGEEVKTYERGAPISVTAAEIAAFPEKFGVIPGATPDETAALQEQLTAAEQRAQDAEQTVKTQETTISGLQTEIKELKAAVKK